MADEARLTADTPRRPGRLRRVAGGFGASFSSLSVRNYRYLWFGQVGAAMGIHADMLARSWLTWELTGSYAQLGGVNLMRALPMLVFGLGGGVIADRFNRKKLLMIIQAWTMGSHALMAVLILGGVIELWHIYAVAFLMGMGMAMNQPVRTTLIPQVVGKERMLNAIALNSIAINSTRFIAPAGIAFIIAQWGTGYAYVVSTAAYMAVIWVTTRLEIDFSAVGRRTSSMASQFIEGIRYVLTQRMILSLVLLGLGPLAFGLAFRNTLLPGLADQRFGDRFDEPEVLLGLLLSAGAIGSVVGALAIGSRANIARRGPLMLGATGLYGAVLLILAAPVALWAVFVLVVTAALSQTIFRTANTAVLLERTPDELRGRVMSVVLLDNALSPVAGLAAGLIADGVGIGGGFLFLGIACMAVLGLAVAFYPRLMRT